MTPAKLKPLLPFLLLFFLIPPALAQPTTPVTVLAVTYGDTFRVEFQGRKESVRLLGIANPESKGRNPG
jgi:endonuclease YncB( thermonuclease family)